MAVHTGSQSAAGSLGDREETGAEHTAKGKAGLSWDTIPLSSPLTSFTLVSPSPQLRQMVSCHCVPLTECEPVHTEPGQENTLANSCLVGELG